MGLRQLYFLIGGLLDRLVYLSYGLALVLGFIGSSSSSRRPTTMVSTGRRRSRPVSLSVILVTLTITAVLSLRTSASMTRKERGAKAERVMSYAPAEEFLTD